MQSEPAVGMKTLELEGIKKTNSGKVREMFEVGDHLLMVATDRLSAFDVVLPDPIPRKGQVLTQISAFWFDLIARQKIVGHHLVSADVEKFPKELERFKSQLRGRSMLVKKCVPLAIECVVRGYLAGSGWKEYRQNGQICGIPLPSGLKESDQLPEPIFTPATKAVTGHDENISFAQASEIVGQETAERVRDYSIRIYNWARQHAAEKGIIICDTKFEFGTIGSELVLIDEVLTPDSSRFWPADQYAPGRSQPSFDKQPMRDYLETLDWNKAYPGPALPAAVIQQTSDRYVEAYERITGKRLSG